MNNAETLKRLEELNQIWANPSSKDPPAIDIATEAMDALPDLIQCVKDRDAALAACAEMRRIVEIAAWNGDCGPEGSRNDYYCADCGAHAAHWDDTVHSEGCKIAHALSTDCGRGFLPPDKAQKLVEALNRAIERLDTTHHNQTLRMCREALAAAKEEK